MFMPFTTLYMPRVGRVVQRSERRYQDTKHTERDFFRVVKITYFNIGINRRQYRDPYNRGRKAFPK